MSFIINPYRFGGYDSDYQAVLDRATALGYTHPSTAKKTIENAAMIAIKAAFGVSSIASAPILQALMFKTDNNAEDYATLNWANPSIRQATKVNSPTFTNNSGFNSDGLTSYLLSGITTLDLSQADFTIAIRATSNITSTNSITGAADGTATAAESLYIILRNPSNLLTLRIFNSGTGSSNVSNNDSTNRFYLGRTDISNLHYSINGTAFTSTAQPFNAADISRDVTILASNNSGGVTNFYIGGCSYRLIFTRKLTDLEVAALDTALSNYLA